MSGAQFIVLGVLIFAVAISAVKHDENPPVTLAAALSVCKGHGPVLGVSGRVVHCGDGKEFEVKK